MVRKHFLNNVSEEAVTTCSVHRGLRTACSMQPPAVDTNGFLLEWGGVGQICLGESQSRLYPHMRAKFGRDPTAVSKKVYFKFISRYRPIYLSNTTPIFELHMAA